MGRTELQSPDIKLITERLRGIPLTLPRSLGEHPAADKKEQYLHSLLSRDAGVFLERHGDVLNDDERALFEPLRPTSFEVEHYMKQLEQSDVSNRFDTTPAERAAVRNRRLAKLKRLDAKDYFSEVMHVSERPASCRHRVQCRQVVWGQVCD